MKTSLLLAVTIAFPLFSQVSTTIPVSEGKNEFRVNTADYYTWNTRTEVYAFKHVKAAEFSHILKNCISAYGKIQINDKQNMIIITEEPNKLKDILALCAKLDTPAMDGFEKIQSEAIPVLYSKASNILPFIRPFLSIEGDARSNDALNFISVTDHVDVIARIKKEIIKFDIPPKEVEFRFHIVEVYKSNDKAIGTSWSEIFNIANGSAGYNYAANSQTSTQSGSSYDMTTKASGLSASVGFNPRAFTDFVKLMIEKKSINLVADNSVLCVNNAASTFSFHYNGKTFQVKMKPTAINDKTLMLRTTIIANGETLLENSTLTEIGTSNLLLRLSTEESQTINRKVPVLGTVLPYLFSRSIKNKNVSSVDIVCTPVMQVVKM